MKIGTNKHKGNCGLTTAISYFTEKGYIVSLPLNDTQEYDFIAEIKGELKKVQVKKTTQKSRYGSTVVDLRNTGGTKGYTYSKVGDSQIDLLFVVNDEMKMWMIPKEDIKNRSTLTLKASKYLVGQFNLKIEDEENLFEMH